MNLHRIKLSRISKNCRTVELRLHRGRQRANLCLVFSLALILILASCSTWLPDWFPGSATNTPVVMPSETTTVMETTVTPTVEDLPSLVPVTLPIWVPPQFDPDANSVAGNLLRERLDAFMENHPDIYVEVRVKSSSGPGSLLEALTTANAAAPAAVPGLIALNRSDLEAAAVKGLIFPLDEFSTAMQDPDWYSYAHQLASLQGSVFGLPFSGNTLILLYRPAKIGSGPFKTWEDILVRGIPLIFQAGDQQSMVTLTLYLSAGGSVEDAQGRPALNPAILADVFNLYQEGYRSGVFPTSVTQYQSTGQAWQAFREGQADWVISWSSNYLGELPADTSAAPLPPLDTDSLTLADGWVWALSDQDPVRRQASIELIEFLVKSEFLTEWSAASGYLPVRPSSLAGWSNESLRPLIDQINQSAQVRPANELMASLGPVLLEGTLSIFKEQISPVQAAQTAAEKLGAP